MSKPRTQVELDEQARLEEQWNAGARRADSTWWQQPHERSEGRNYKRVCIGADKYGRPVWEQVEDWK